MGGNLSCSRNGFAIQEISALNFNLSLGTNCIWSRTIYLVQLSWVSLHSLAKVSFKVGMVFPTFLNDWGLQAECKVHFTPRALIISFVAFWDTNAGSLSLYGNPWSPNLGIISLSNDLAISAAISVLVGNTSVHLESVLSTTVKLICQSPPAYVPLVWIGLILRPLKGWSGVGVVHCIDGHVSIIQLIILFMSGVTVTSTNQLNRASLPEWVPRRASLKAWQAAVWGRKYRPCYCCRASL